MSRSFTVYFDTSFYVRLCRADETDAFAVIDDLNALNVCHVISDVIIGELLTSKARSDLDEILVVRLNRFRLLPYTTRDGLCWEVLLLSGHERAFVADVMRNIHDQMTRATSYSILAKRDLNSEQKAMLAKQVVPELARFGFPKDFERDKDEALTAARNMLQAFGIEGIEWPESATPESLFTVYEQLMSFLGDSVVAELHEQSRVQDSITTSEDRPYQVATRTASDKTKKRLSNTLRDSEHMMMFIKHRSEIDALQVDVAQETLIRRVKPRHRVAELGLADRCFAADSLANVVDKVRSLRTSCLQGLASRQKQIILILTARCANARIFQVVHLLQS